MNVKTYKDIINYDIDSISTNCESVICNGQQLPYGHPKVYLSIDKNTNKVTCPYCNHVFQVSQKKPIPLPTLP